MIRSVLEGVTFGMNDQLRIMRGMGVKLSTVRLSGGGAKSAFWRQLQADIYGTKCATINSDEGPAYGVALLAGVGTGVWKNVPQACSAAIKETATFKPSTKLKKEYSARHDQYTRLYHAMEKEYDIIAALG